MPAAAIPSPMLAKVYDPARASFPCIVQPKLDGVRLLVRRRVGGQLELFSRTGKPLDHLAGMLEADLTLSRLPQGVVLDGELYVHGAGFQTVVSLVRNKGMSDARREKLEYHVYDLVEAAPYEQRAAHLERLLKGQMKRVRLVTSEPAAGPADVDAALRRYMRAGYEGVIVRDPAAPYAVGRRSPGLLKYKLFRDDEFRIIAVVEASGKDAGTAVLRCVTKEGREFNVRPQGTREHRGHLLRDASLIIGKQLTVRFQELSDDLVPRFPIGIAVRDYE